MPIVTSFSEGEKRRSRFNPMKAQDIRSEPEALDAFANAGNFILIGNRHGLPSDLQENIDLLPTLARSNVSVIGLELPTSFNPVFSEIQDRIRKGATLEQTEQMVAENMKKRGWSFTGGSNDLQETAAVLYSATQLKMKVVGIDGRSVESPGPHPADVKSKASMSITDQHDIMMYSNDRESAQNAATALAGERQGSRMAIIYGDNHLRKEGKVVRLSEALEKHGAVTVVAPDMSVTDSRSNVSYRLDAAALHQDKITRDKRDNRKSIVLMAPH